MTDHPHPLTETRVEKLWNAHVPSVLNFQRWNWGDRIGILAALRAAYDAGREDALTPLDPLDDLTLGTVIRDVTIKGYGAAGKAFILADANGPVAATAHGFYYLSFLTAFTTYDRRTRWTCNGDTWTAENLERP